MYGRTVFGCGGEANPNYDLKAQGMHISPTRPAVDRKITQYPTRPYKASVLPRVASLHPQVRQIMMCIVCLSLSAGSCSLQIVKGTPAQSRNCVTELCWVRLCLLQAGAASYLRLSGFADFSVRTDTARVWQPRPESVPVDGNDV